MLIWQQKFILSKQSLFSLKGLYLVAPSLNLEGLSVPLAELQDFLWQVFWIHIPSKHKNRIFWLQQIFVRTVCTSLNSYEYFPRGHGGFAVRASCSVGSLAFLNVPLLNCGTLCFKGRELFFGRQLIAVTRACWRWRVFILSFPTAFARSSFISDLVKATCCSKELSSSTTNLYRRTQSMCSQETLFFALFKKKGHEQDSVDLMMTSYKPVLPLTCKCAVQLLTSIASLLISKVCRPSLAFPNEVRSALLPPFL